MSQPARTPPSLREVASWQNSQAAQLGSKQQEPGAVGPPAVRRRGAGRLAQKHDVIPTAWSGGGWVVLHLEWA